MGVGRYVTTLSCKLWAAPCKRWQSSTMAISDKLLILFCATVLELRSWHCMQEWYDSTGGRWQHSVSIWQFRFLVDGEGWKGMREGETILWEFQKAAGLIGGDRKCFWPAPAPAPAPALYAWWIVHHVWISFHLLWFVLYLHEHGRWCSLKSIWAIDWLPNECIPSLLAEWWVATEGSSHVAMHALASDKTPPLSFAWKTHMGSIASCFVAPERAFSRYETPFFWNPQEVVFPLKPSETKEHTKKPTEVDTQFYMLFVRNTQRN